MAIATWVAYLIFAFAVMPVYFRVRFGRWPFTVSIPPQNRYDLVEYLYGAMIVVFTIALVAEAPPAATTARAGLAMMGSGVLLQCWAILVLGPNWRIGQDVTDSGCTYVRAVPYRLFSHPIYASMCVIAIGQAMVMGWNRLSVSLFLGNLLYGCVQGGTESLRWRGASGNRHPAATASDVPCGFEIGRRRGDR